MNFDMGIFNNREIAILIWTLIALAWMSSQKNIRISILNVLFCLRQKKIIMIFISMFVYVILIVFLLYKIEIWDISMAKDTFFWLFGIAIVMLINFNHANEDKQYFKKIVLDNFRLILILEFVVNFYVFNFVVELIMVPMLSIIVLMGTVAGTQKEYMVVEKIMNSILAIFGICFIVFSCFSIANNFQNFATVANLYSFLLPIILTIVYLPFIYFIALYAAYENIFVRLDSLLNHDKMLARFAKQRILILCFINLRKLNRFSSKGVMKLAGLDNRDDVLCIIQQFKNNQIDDIDRTF